MSESKDKNLTNIPPELANVFSRETNKGLDENLSIQGAIKAMRQKMIAPVASTTPEVAQQKQFTPRAVDGYVLNVPNDPYQAGILLFSYLLAKVWSKDPKVKKILSQFNFSMADINGEQIYPPKKKKNDR